MDSAVLKVSSIGVLLPSFSLPNVVDVNEHDGCTNDILCDIKVGLAAALKHHSYSSACLLSALEREKESNKKRGSLASRIYSWCRNRNKSEERAQIPLSSVADTLVETIANKSKLFNTSVLTETQEILNKLYVALTTDDKTGESQEWKNLVQPELLLKLKIYPAEVETFVFCTLLRFACAAGLRASAVEECCLNRTVSDLICSEWRGLNVDVEKLLEEKVNNPNYQISKSLKTAIVGGIERQNILLPVFQYCIKRINDKLGWLVREMKRLEGATKPEDSSRQQQRQQQLPSMAAFDRIELFCQLQLLYIDDRQVSEYILELVELCSKKESHKFDFKEWLNTYKRLRLTLSHRWSVADAIWVKLNDLQSSAFAVNNSVPKRTEAFISHFGQRSIDALKLRCERAKKDTVDTVRQIRNTTTTTSQTNRMVKHNEKVVGIHSGPEPPVQQSDVERIMRVLKFLMLP